MAKPEKESYLNDISKIDQMFDCPMKDKQLKLPEGHKIPLADEIKGKKYRKLRHSLGLTLPTIALFSKILFRRL